MTCLYMGFCFVKKETDIGDRDENGNLLPPEKVSDILRTGWTARCPLSCWSVSSPRTTRKKLACIKDGLYDALKPSIIQVFSGLMVGAFAYGSQLEVVKEYAAAGAQLADAGQGMPHRFLYRRPCQRHAEKGRGPDAVHVPGRFGMSWSKFRHMEWS